jgi:hypothetical protein
VASFTQLGVRGECMGVKGAEDSTFRQEVEANARAIAWHTHLGTVHYHSPENDIFESQAVPRKNGDGDDFGRFGLI